MKIKLKEAVVEVPDEVGEQFLIEHELVADEHVQFRASPEGVFGKWHYEFQFPIEFEKVEE